MRIFGNGTINQKTGQKKLVAALAHHIAQNPEKLDEICHLLAPKHSQEALWYWSEQIAQYDEYYKFPPTFIQITLETKHCVCLRGYLSIIRIRNPNLYFSTLNQFFEQENTAWLGTTIVLYSDYDDDLLTKCLTTLEKRWVEPHIFGILCFGQRLNSIPADKIGQILHLLHKYDSQNVLFLIVELLNSIPFDHTACFDSAFVFDVLSRIIPNRENKNQMLGYYWEKVCQKLIIWDKKHLLLLLDMLLTQMKENYSLSYDHVVALTYKLVQTDPVGSWQIIKRHLEETLLYQCAGLLNWLKGGLGRFDEVVSSQGLIGFLPIEDILAWIEQDPQPRSVLMAHAAPKTLDGTEGQLTRILLQKYGNISDVENTISETFHSGGWTGSRALHLKQKRNKFREWLASGFEIEVIQWLEREIEYLDKKIEQAEIEEERSTFD